MHGEFATLRDSWMLAMDADGYSARTQVSYQQAHRSLEKWIVGNAPGVGPEEITREHVRGWLVDLRATSRANTARSWFAGVRHFCKWMVAEGETDTDATQGIKTPRAGEPLTPVLSSKDIRAMLTACSGTDFACRRDAAIIMVFADGGLRLAEVTGLQVADIDLRDRILFVIGKGSNRSGPRRRSVQLGVKAARALDRYLRTRARHPYHDQPQLWLGARNRPRLSADGVEAVLKRRGSQAGVQVHPHQFRHTWASEFRQAGGEEGDLMVLGGWRSRAMLDRYGRTAAADRAQASYRRHSLGDRL
jgi:site-specific recombinase XerD